MTRTSSALVSKLAYRPGEAVQASGISRSTLYFLINSGEIPTFKIGKTTLIMHDDLVTFLRQRVNATKRAPKKRANGTKRGRKK